MSGRESYKNLLFIFHIEKNKFKYHIFFRTYIRGRPVKSQIRQNILEILYHLKRGYGYDISKVYNSVFPAVTMRSIYYHLKKGVELNEIVVHKIKTENGEYSWGSAVEKTYYMMGPEGKAKGIPKIKSFLTKRKRR